LCCFVFSSHTLFSPLLLEVIKVFEILQTQTQVVWQRRQRGRNVRRRRENPWSGLTSVFAVTGAICVSHAMAASFCLCTRPILVVKESSSILQAITVDFSQKTRIRFYTTDHTHTMKQRGGVVREMAVLWAIELFL
jgi:hypothetical protein